MREPIESFKINVFEERAGRSPSLVVNIGNKEGTSASLWLPQRAPN
jgi:hypothetical protein